MTNDISGQTMPANWYADPGNPSQLRWWSGIAWTEHTHQLQQAPVVAAPSFQPGFGQQGYQAPPTNLGHPVQPAVQQHNGSAWWALGLGLLSAVFTISVLINSSTSVIVSTSGIFAIVNGVRALRLVADGRANARIPAIIGIALGSIGTIIMLASFVGVFRS